jgi:uncharacterized OsmC-like protein
MASRGGTFARPDVAAMSLPLSGATCMSTLDFDIQFPGGKKVDVRIGDHLIRTDQSVPSGGEASAPEPFDLFLASIATCAGVYALGFCHTRRLPTTGLGLRMLCERDEAGKRFAKILIELTLPAGFPEKYRVGILRAMDLCAVKRHILEAPEFEMRIAKD